MIKKIGGRPQLDALHEVLVGVPADFNGDRDSFRGRASSDAGETGDLPEPYRLQYHSARLDGLVLFTIYSFTTPIAWLQRGPQGAQWVVPPVKYTRTTTAHQSRVREVLAGFNRNGR